MSSTDTHRHENDGHVQQVVKRQAQVRKQIRHFARALGAQEVSVRIYEEIGLTTALVGLPSRSYLSRVSDAEKEVARKFSDLAFEILVYYPEDVERRSVTSLIERSSAI